MRRGGATHGAYRMEFLGKCGDACASVCRGRGRAAAVAALRARAGRIRNRIASRSAARALGIAPRCRSVCPTSNTAGVTASPPSTSTRPAPTAATTVVRDLLPGDHLGRDGDEALVVAAAREQRHVEPREVARRDELPPLPPRHPQRLPAPSGVDHPRDAPVDAHRRARDAGGAHHRARPEDVPPHRALAAHRREEGLAARLGRPVVVRAPQRVVRVHPRPPGAVHRRGRGVDHVLHARVRGAFEEPRAGAEVGEREVVGRVAPDQREVDARVVRRERVSPGRRVFELPRVNVTPGRAPNAAARRGSRASTVTSWPASESARTT